MNRESKIKQALNQFFRTTTLHGFKYFCSEYLFIDRLAWLAGCVASACCAGVLCAVLWARFLEVPAVLELRELPANTSLAQHMPRVAVCPPVAGFTAAFLRHINGNVSVTHRLTNTIKNVLAGKNTAKSRLDVLEELLSSQNISLTDMMMKYSPACDNLIMMCRWQQVIVPCKALFNKELTNYGVCCIMRAEKAYYRLLNEPVRPMAHFGRIRTLDLTLQCSNKTRSGCDFYAKYDDEASIETVELTPGFLYLAIILFSSVPMSSTEEFLESNCNNDKSYSKEICLDKCAAQFCGCSDPLREIEIEDGNNLPPCTVSQLGCLNGYHNNITSNCECMPSCNKMESRISLASTRLNLESFTLDPIYDGLNSTSTVMHIKLNIPLSKMFTLNPTETWLTLLSSLGGVFNMFLGVGLFSALEIIFLLLFKLPIAFLRSPYN